MFLVSRCCAGALCRYRGNGYLIKRVAEMAKTENFVTCCPEVDGGLPIPREGCSVVKGRVIGRKTGRDYTEAYMLGARNALAICKALGIKRAYMLKNSPACGKDYGVAAKHLEKNGVEVIAL